MKYLERVADQMLKDRTLQKMFMMLGRAEKA